MYKIIGADQREYGPCSADELRRWFREGRLNAQSMLQAAGATEWKPLAAYPEFADLLTGAPSPTAPPTIGPTTGVPAQPAIPVPIAEIEQRDYSIDIFGCVSRAWGLLQKHFWPIIGISLLVRLADGAINQIIEMFTYPSMGEQLMKSLTDPSFNQSGDPGAMINQSTIMGFSFSPTSGLLVALAVILSAPLKALLTGGLFYYFLKLIRGETAELSDAFSGFSRALVPLLLLGLVKSLLLMCGIALCVLPGIYLAVAWSFSVPLVADRRMDFWAAMELSRKLVSRHWFVILGLILVNGLVAASGFIACCVGVIVTLPLAQIAMLYAYEDIFGRRTSAQV